jgi:hypothetical protein
MIGLQSLFFKRLVTTLFLGAFLVQLSNCAPVQKTPENESTDEFAAVLAVPYVFSAIAAGVAYLAIGQSIQLAGHNIFNYRSKSVSNAFDKLIAEENALIQTSLNKNESVLGTTPQKISQKLKFDASQAAGLVNSARAALRKAKTKDYQNDKNTHELCATAVVRSRKLGASFSGSFPFTSSATATAAVFAAVSKAYMKCFNSNYATNPDFQGAVNAYIPQNALPSPSLGAFVGHAILTYHVGMVKELKAACSVPDLPIQVKKVPRGACK